MGSSIIEAGQIPAAARSLEQVLRRARALDGELRELFELAGRVRDELANTGVRSIEYGYPPLVDAAAEVYDALELELEERAAHAAREKGL